MQVVQPTFIDNVPRARECAGLWEGNASPCPQGALSLVRETDQPVMTAGQCGASNDRHGVGGGGRGGRREAQPDAGWVWGWWCWRSGSTERRGPLHTGAWERGRALLASDERRCLLCWAMGQRQGSVKMQHCATGVGARRSSRLLEREGQGQWETSLRAWCDIWGNVEFVSAPGLFARAPVHTVGEEEQRKVHGQWSPLGTRFCSPPSGVLLLLEGFKGKIPIKLSTDRWWSKVMINLVRLLNMHEMPFLMHCDECFPWLT